MNVTVKQFKAAKYHTVVGSGMLGISEGQLLAYSRLVAGSSFSCYEYSYYKGARKVTIHKQESGAILVELVGEKFVPARIME